MIIRSDDKIEVITKGIHIEFSNRKMKILKQDKQMYPLGKFSVVNTDASIKIISCDVPEIRDYIGGEYDIRDNICKSIRIGKIIYGKRFLNYRTTYTIFIIGDRSDRDECFDENIDDDIIFKLNELLEIYEKMVWCVGYEKIDL